MFKLLIFVFSVQHTFQELQQVRQNPQLQPTNGAGSVLTTPQTTWGDHCNKIYDGSIFNLHDILDALRSKLCGKKSKFKQIYINSSSYLVESKENQTNGSNAVLLHNSRCKLISRVQSKDIVSTRQ